MPNVLRASCTANNTSGQPGDAAEILVDGSDTPITANGLSTYAPSPGDRLLVTQVGGQVEIVQFVSVGTVPYVTSGDLNNVTDALATVLGTDPTVQAGLINAGSADTLLDTLNTLQTQHDVVGSTDPTAPNYNLGGIGPVGITEDQIWVGDSTDNTVKLVPISAFTQALIGAPDVQTFLADLGIGDVGFTDVVNPPMTTFYAYLGAHGIAPSISGSFAGAVASKDYGA